MFEMCKHPHRTMNPGEWKAMLEADVEACEYHGFVKEWLRCVRRLEIYYPSEPPTIPVTPEFYEMLVEYFRSTRQFDLSVDEEGMRVKKLFVHPEVIVNGNSQHLEPPVVGYQRERDRLPPRRPG